MTGGVATNPAWMTSPAAMRAKRLRADDFSGGRQMPERHGRDDIAHRRHVPRGDDLAGEQRVARPHVVSDDTDVCADPQAAPSGPGT